MDKLNLCAGILCIIITIIGITTNLLTLLAIPFAAKRKKYVPIYGAAGLIILCRLE